MDRETRLRHEPLTRLLAAAVVALVVGGCAMLPWGARQPAPDVRDAKPVDRARREVPAVHVVRRRETLSAVAWRYGLDYRSIARWNRINPPYVIYPGQRLALRGPPNRGAGAQGPKAAAGKRRPVDSTASSVPVKGWVWPAKGKVVGRFGKGGNDGIDIGGRRGQPVMAAKDGRVVYTGSGLVGYGRLVIVKHTERLLSAYAHNDRLLVKEGQTVRAGQKIAEMGSTGADRVQLHFEVRRDGKPLNPMKYLSRRG